MEEIIKKKCKAAGIDPDILTQEERSALIAEIRAEQEGKMILDGILTQLSIKGRQIMKDLDK